MAKKRLTKDRRLLLESMAATREAKEPGSYVYLVDYGTAEILEEMGYLESEYARFGHEKKWRITPAGAAAINRADLFADTAQPAPDTQGFGVEDDTIYSIAPVARYEVGIGSGADEYTRDEERARLLAEIKRLEEALEPFADAFKAYQEWSVTNGAQGMTKWLYYRCDDEAVEANYKAANEALAEPAQEG